VNNIIVVLPDTWDIKKVRYVKAPVEQPLLLDMDKIPSPLEDPYSFLNFRQHPAKLFSRMDLYDMAMESGFAHQPEWDVGMDQHTELPNQHQLDSQHGSKFAQSTDS
jgi:hypothetical protein